MEKVNIQHLREDLEKMLQETDKEIAELVKPYQGETPDEQIDNMMFTFNIDTSEDFTALEKYQYKLGYERAIEDILIKLLHIEQ